MGNVTPQAGGCWYCWTTGADLVFSNEFDTYVHPDCVRQRLVDDPNDREAELIYDELVAAGKMEGF